MAKKTAPPPQPGPPQVTPSQGIDLLNRQIAQAESVLASRKLSCDDHSAWELVTKNYLEKAFGVNSPNVSSVVDVGKYGLLSAYTTEADREADRLGALETQVSQLKGLVELLKTEIQLGETGKADIARVERRAGHKVFLVHGHDERLLHESARFLQKLEQDVVVLREQPNEGRTIIEKFEDHSDVGFAVVLLTPDDRGGPKDAALEEQRPRARQNVVFEFGYFIGRLGRNRVCGLYRGGVDLPSDVSGVLYVEVDERGAWKLELARELKAAGLPVDMNNAM